MTCNFAYHAKGTQQEQQELKILQSKTQRKIFGLKVRNFAGAQERILKTSDLKEELRGRLRWVDNGKMHLRERDYDAASWIKPAQDFWALVLLTFNLRFLLRELFIYLIR
jgi:hypothetical protein